MTETISWLEDEPAQDNDFDWLDNPTSTAEEIQAQIERLQQQLTTAATAAQATKVEAAHKLPLEQLRGKAMYQHVNGRRRIWACDGEYVFFRRKSCIDPARPGYVHEAVKRHQRFLDRGDYTYVGTQDDVEICRINPQSTFFRPGVYLGTMTEGGVRQAVVLAACMRDWPLYVDCLTELASKVKGTFHEGYAKKRWEEHLVYVNHLIAMRRGPTPAECAAGMQQVRQARGEGGGKLILLPSR